MNILSTATGNWYVPTDRLAKGLNLSIYLANIWLPKLDDVIACSELSAREVGEQEILVQKHRNPCGTSGQKGAVESFPRSVNALHTDIIECAVV